ncbi:unnamed protein product [Callosobruchus maculatus]|uniref:Endonuclease/exonuclease/phosphatase domain-containing protein n=1 Tax=Callosobruchus maculatus TaxID=64391 RepID=A0A653CKL1_CALMS|nr:unnamed protein product [Callosobruchus maculatus]
MSSILTRQAKNMVKNQECIQQDKALGQPIKEDILNTILRKIEARDGTGDSNRIKIEEANKKIEQMEQFSKRCNLRFFGIPETNNEKCRDVIIDIIRTKLDLSSISTEDIEVAYRSGSSKGNAPRVMFVRFYSAKVKNDVYSNKKNLKGSRITIREDLTATRMTIVKEKIARHGKNQVWTTNGRIVWLEDGNGKLEDIKTILYDNNIDVLAISETWLNERIETSYVTIDGYTFLRRDRGSRGGGVGLHISNSLKFKKITSSGEIEQLWDVDEKIEYLNNAIISVLDMHAPYKLVRFTKKPATWLTDNLRFIMHLRDAAKAKFNQTKSVESWEKYKKAKNFATQALWCSCIIEKKQKGMKNNNEIKNSTIKKKKLKY